MRNNDENLGVLDKICAILSCIRTKATGMTLTEIARTSGINKSTAHRLLMGLVKRGLLQRTDDGQFAIGSFLVQLAMGAPAPLGLRTTAQPVMAELARETGETVNLAILEGTDILIINVIESSHEFRMAAQIGSRRPFYATAMGKSIAAFLREDNSERLLSRLELPLMAPTPNSVQDLTQLREELARTRERGYAIDDEEAVSGVRAAAAPVFSSSEEPEAGLSISGPASRLSSKRIPALVSLVRRAADRISAQFGSRTGILQVEKVQAGGRKSALRSKN